MTMPEAITGYQLFMLLAELDAEQMQLPVKVEGCDCYGECSGISVETAPLVLYSKTPVSYLLLTRHDV